MFGYCFVRACMALRRCVFAATPPPTMMFFGVCVSVARRVFSVRVSTTASSNSIAIAALSVSERLGCFSQYTRTAVLSPAYEKLSVVSWSIGRGKVVGEVWFCLRAVVARCASAGPPG